MNFSQVRRAGRRCALGLVLSVGVLLGAAGQAPVHAAVAVAPEARPIPANGHLDPALAPIDAMILEYMQEHEIPGLVFGLMKNGRVLAQRGYGWRDGAMNEPMPYDAMLRIASVSKHVTVAAVRELIDDGLLTLEDKAFDVGQPGGGVLPIEPFPELGDERIKDITIDHLIHHRGGWDRSKAGDLTYREIDIAEAFGVPSPPGRERTLRWILGQPLQFDPGAERAYSNVGCLTLGLIVEHLTGRDLMEVIHERVLAPIGVAETEHAMGRTKREHADPREPVYHCGRTGRDVFDPNGEEVVYAYGGWHQEARKGQGAHISTTSTILALLEHRWVNGPNIGARRDASARGNWRWNHGGALPGTFANARQRGDGVHFVIITNRRKPGDPAFASQLRDRIDDLLDNGEIVWPGAEEVEAIEAVTD